MPSAKNKQEVKGVALLSDKERNIAKRRIRNLNLFFTLKRLGATSEHRKVKGETKIRNLAGNISRYALKMKKKSAQQFFSQTKSLPKSASKKATPSRNKVKK